MNIESSNINQVNKNKTEQPTQASTQASEASSFAEELKMKNNEDISSDVKSTVELETNEDINTKDKTNIKVETKEKEKEKEKEKVNINENISDVFKDLNAIVKELNQSDEKVDISIKPTVNNADKTEKGEILINNDINISENKELMPQMNPNMNFSGNGEFSSLMQNNTENQKITSSAKDLAEEAEILSTMAENILIANKKSNKVEEEKPIVQVKRNIFDQETKIVTRNNTIKKVETSTNITVENIVKYDSIIMNEADVEVFAQLIENKEVNLKNLTNSQVEKSVKVSKTLADMLVKSMENNKPLRIDFDNNISVIIKISRDGKISADFLPSSHVAEAYLKENLPLLRQRFDDNNIKYDELNQRERREQKEHSRKKGRDNE